MGVLYTARMQFGPHQDSEQIMREVLEICREGRIDEVMFFAFAEEQNDGHDRIERLRQWMGAIRPWKRALEAAGVEVSLNPWHTVLHTDRGRTLKPEQGWQNMMDWRGQAATAVVCPLDPGWREYYDEALRTFAVEGFRVIWIDDDIRYHNHGDLDWGGCWCPLHVEEFCRRAGASASRDEVVARATQPGPPHPWRQIWLDMWDELHCELIAHWRGIVEGAGSSLGLMSSRPEIHSMEGRRWDRWWKALGKRFPNVHRPHYWGYSDAMHSMLIYGIEQMQMNRLIQPIEVESDPEIENFPYGPWNKSFRQTAAQMALAQVFGSTRLAVSLYDFMGNLPSDEPDRAAFLARIKPMLAWLGDQFSPAMSPVGVGVPWEPDMSRKVHTAPASSPTASGGGWDALEVSTCGWDHWLGPFGFAFQKSPHPVVNALAGAMTWTFDDDTLRQWLSRGLLLDGPAAAILVERGLGDLVGLADIRFIAQAEILYSMEESLDDGCCGATASFGLRSGAQMSLNAEGKQYKDRLIQGRLLPNARLISVLRGPRQDEVGHGAVLFENAAGGRVAVMPWDATAGTNLCTQRQAQLRKVIAWLGPGASCGSVSGGAWLIPQFFTDTRNDRRNGLRSAKANPRFARWRGVVWNGSPDAIAEFTVTPPSGMPPIVRAVHCSADGQRTEAVVENLGASDTGVFGDVRVTAKAPIHQWEFVVLNPEG